MDTEATAPGPSDETKRKFREALERKKQGAEKPGGHVEGESAVHGAQPRADHKRDFRRKTG